MQHPNYLQAVRDQYESYPYPLRNPENEKHMLLATLTGGLDCINHYCFSGKQDFKNKFRVLDAGGGTGDATIFLAEQLRDTDAEIVYIDFSQASLDIARKRAEVRGLTNITWVHDSLLSISSLNLGQFDFINCSGVLHHLENPEAGLAAITAVLKDSGAMSIMVYAKYGRTAIYQVQELLHHVHSEKTPMQEQIENCKKLLNNITDNHWYKLAGYNFTELNKEGDAGIYDLFLHSQDRAYSIPELYHLVEGAGLKIGPFFAEREKRGNGLYDPVAYITDSELLAKVKALPLKTQQAVAELMHGRISKHTFYAAKTERPLPQLDDMDNIPCYNSFYGKELQETLYRMASQPKEMVTFGDSATGAAVRFKKTPYTALICKYMDGQNTIGDIINKVSAEVGKMPDMAIIHKELSAIFSGMNFHNWMFLRHKVAPDFRKILDKYRQAGSTRTDR